jgi:predicted kinase
VLIILAGLPGTGKTTIARELAPPLGAVHIRIDSIEQAMRESGVLVASLDDAGYRAAYAVAEDNLRLGHTVIADSVNPVQATRNAWIDVANRVGVGFAQVEITCSDQQEHRRRVEARTADIAGHRLPTWSEVVAREYNPWDRERIVLDTARASPEESVTKLRALLVSRAT